MLSCELSVGSWSGPWEKLPGKPPALESGEVHIWQLRPSPAWGEQLLPHECERFSRIQHPGAKADYAASRGGLRALLSLYRPEKPEEIPMQRGLRGKPYLEGGPEFNLSHTAGGVFVAVSKAAVGLDVEAAARRVHAAELARKFFTDAELRALLELEGGKRDGAFIRYWVAKEAMVKLSGEGIFVGLREAELSQRREGKMEAKYRNRKVFLQELWPREDLRAALTTWEPVVLKGFFRL